jgi:hypothetical protein
MVCSSGAARIHARDWRRQHARGVATTLARRRGHALSGSPTLTKHKNHVVKNALKTPRQRGCFRVHEARVAQGFKLSGRALLEIQFVDFL